MAKKEILAVFSGGPDSTASVLWAIQNGYSPKLITFNFFGNRQYGEIGASYNVARNLNLVHKVVSMESAIAEFGADIRPMVHATTKKEGQSSIMPLGATFVLSYAVSFAIQNGIEELVWGATKDDSKSHAEYQREYLDKFQELIALSTGHSIKIHTPLIELHKPQIFKAYFSDSPDLLAQTWSCKVHDNVVHCGSCTACIARRAAADLEKIVDQTEYCETEFENPVPEDRREDYLTYIAENNFADSAGFFER